MNRIASVLAFLLLASGTSSLAAAGEDVAVNLLMGSYIDYMGMEPEWSVELRLGRGGSATYTVYTREPGANPSTRKSATFPGRWERTLNSLTVRFSEDAADKALEYRISECVYYVSNTSVVCSPGLEPVTTITPHMFSQQLIFVVKPGPVPLGP